tara:strand:+ start:90 stop:257 length:168 start_codon:yes stop_codon:yes gene_type:complete
MEQVTKAVRMSKKLADQLELLATEDDRSFSQLVRIILQSAATEITLNNRHIKSKA